MYRRDPDELAAARAELVSYGERLLADGLSVGSAGNLSVRAGDTVAITPTGVAYQDVTAAVAVTGGADGCLIAWRGGGAPVSLPAIKVAGARRTTRAGADR
jgi:ribulose-5-phosphate 4-epimerase/fuculose-1-phosphate aldolase